MVCYVRRKSDKQDSNLALTTFYHHVLFIPLLTSSGDLILWDQHQAGGGVHQASHLPHQRTHQVVRWHHQVVRRIWARSVLAVRHGGAVCAPRRVRDVEGNRQRAVSSAGRVWLGTVWLLCSRLFEIGIDDVTSVYLQQTQRIGFIDTLEWTTAILYGSLQGLCNVAGVLNGHALTKHDACANCRAK